MFYVFFFQFLQIITANFKYNFQSFSIIFKNKIMKQDKDINERKYKIKIIVVGGDPAGVQAALRAHELGADVTIIESNRLGETAFNEGPAPVRTLVRAARLRADTSLYSKFGLRGETIMKKPSTTLIV